MRVGKQWTDEHRSTPKTGSGRLKNSKGLVTGAATRSSGYRELVFLSFQFFNNRPQKELSGFPPPCALGKTETNLRELIFLLQTSFPSIRNVSLMAFLFAHQDSEASANISLPLKS
ncbi:hypothetical protein TNCV_3673931 [Trichonephila clavipes]|nr:hypothetical protein TNCV_3673931 [Trichonephila clavipes]